MLWDGVKLYEPMYERLDADFQNEVSYLIIVA